MVDFETSIHNAFRSKWPGIELVGRRFHLRQACGIGRYVQWLGLQNAYQKVKVKTC